MSATPDTIWQVPAYLPYLQPLLTDEVVALAEVKIGHTLPDAYLDLLRAQNGGYIRYSFPEMVHRIIAGIGPHFPSLINRNLEAGQDYVSFPLKGLFPFDGDGHWYICLDYRQNTSNPSISYVNIECDRQTSVADSFAEYLSKLTLDVENQFVLEEVDDIEALKSQLSSALSISFDAPDTSSQGYPIERTRLGTDADSQWIFISPNVVPRGFVRLRDRRFSELKDLFPGSAPRFPELPKNSHILKATDSVKVKIIDAITRSGFVVRPLCEYLK